MEEDLYPPPSAPNEMNLRYYTKPAEYYFRMYEDGSALFRTADADYGRSAAARNRVLKDVDLACRRRRHAVCGLLARGADSIPYAMRLLKDASADAREDGAYILGTVGQQPGVVEAVMGALDAEEDLVALSSLIHALGALGNPAAIPKLAAILRDPDMDGDTKWDAAESLGRLVRRNFRRLPDPVASALNWLAKHGH